MLEKTTVRNGIQGGDEIVAGIVEDLGTDEEYKVLRRKIDCTVLPMMAAIFFLQYLDKQSLSYAGIFGLITDLNLTGDQYSWCSSIFYLGQLVAEYPFIYLMSRFNLPRFVGITVIVWGLICMCLASPKSFAGFATVRCLLGMAEGAVSPAFVSITGIWYRKDEHAVRVALWISMNGLAQIIGCLLMYGIGKNPSLALAPWRTMFLVCGAITSAAGCVFCFLMPQNPGDAWFLTAREKHIISVRMSRDREGGDKTSFSIPQLREFLLDLKAWFALFFGILITMQSPVLTFASFIIRDIGYDKFRTLLWTAPSGAVQISLLWLGVVGCLLFPRQRTLVAMTLVIPPLVGCLLLLKLQKSAQWGIIAASWMASCITASWSVILSLMASNIKGNTKRATTNTVFFIGYCVGAIAGPQLWTHQPRYLSGVISAIVTWCLLFVTILTYRLLCQLDNRTRDQSLASDSPVDPTAAAALGTAQSETDLTDKQDVCFRYSI